MQSDGHQRAEARFRQAQAAKLVMQRGVLPNQTAAESIGSQALSRTVSVAHPFGPDLDIAPIDARHFRQLAAPHQRTETEKCEAATELCDLPGVIAKLMWRLNVSKP
jgi:hypothetical protein